MTRAETISEWERTRKPAAIEAAWRKTSLDGALCSIVVIAYCIDDHAVQSVQTEDYTSPHAEKKLLEDFLRKLRADVWAAANPGQMADFPGFREETITGCLRAATYYGHNVGNFDLRVLYQRMVVHQVTPAAGLPFAPDAPRFALRDQVFDCMAQWCGFGKFASLDSVCQALGIEGKGSELGGEDIDGSKVQDFLEAGRIEDVRIYCEADVERVRQIYRRLTFVD